MAGVVALIAVAAFVGRNTIGLSPDGPGTADGLSATYLDSQSGDWIGQGLTMFMIPTDDYPIHINGDDPREIRGSSSFPNADVPYVVFNFNAGTGLPLAVGAYELGLRQGAAGIPKLEITASWRGCNKSVGRFEILQLEYSAPKVVSRFAASFEQHCDKLVALFGEIRYNSTGQPLSALLVTPGTLAFDEVGSSKTVTIQNPGTTVQHLTIGVHGPSPDAFETSGDCSTVAAGASCNIVVKLVGDRSGTRTGQLVILDETRQGRRSVALTGPGLPAASVVVSADPNPATAGPVTLTATTNAPSGSVEFYNDNVLLGTAAVNDGIATLHPTISAGTHWIFATYMGSPTLAITDSAPLQLVVNP